MIVRWGLDAYPELLAQLGISDPLLVTTERWRDVVSELGDDVCFGVRPHVPSASVDEVIADIRGCDGLVPLGGGSAIDTAKAASAATGLPVVSIPTTYSGAEWTPFFGVLDEKRRVKGGGGGARLAGIVYEPALTLDFPREESVGTALNALAHCAEALYVKGKNPDADRLALAGAAAIAASLPRVVADGHDREARAELLSGAASAGEALALAGLGLGHAMAQALGGRYALPHGALNAICLPLALRFNAPVAGDEIERFGRAMGTEDPVGRVQELALLGGYERLRDLGVPEDELDEVAEAVVARPGARANPRRASADEVADLLRSVY